MRHELLLNLSRMGRDFESFEETSTEGKWFVSRGPVYRFAQRLQEATEAIQAPSLEGAVTWEFLDYEGLRWADHGDLETPSDEFWATTFLFKGQSHPRKESHRAGLASRAWILCWTECARRYFPEFFEAPSSEELQRRVQIQRPSPIRLAENRLYETFGFPWRLRFSYETRLDIVRNVADKMLT